MFAGRHCAHLCPPIYPWSARHICISKMQEGCFFRNTDCVWELNQREKDAALFAFTGSRNPYAVWSNLGLCHSTFSDTSIFLLFVFNPTRKHHEIVCQNPLKCLHEVICDQTIVVVAILSWYVVVTVTPKRIEKIEQHLSLITILANFTKFYLLGDCDWAHFLRPSRPSPGASSQGCGGPGWGNFPSHEADYPR